MSWSKLFEPYMHQRLQSWKRQISGWLPGIRTGKRETAGRLTQRVLDPKTIAICRIDMG